jgi:hypothetical protein
MRANLQQRPKRLEARVKPADEPGEFVIEFVGPDQEALMQELQWRPQPLGTSSQTESAKDVVFSFYEGKLFRIVVDYDRYETEGLTADDFVDAISAHVPGLGVGQLRKEDQIGRLSSDDLRVGGVAQT